MSDLESPFKHLTHEIRLDRTYYARSSQIFAWLLDHVGSGHAYEYTTPMTDYSQTLWHAYQLFGNTVIRFAHAEHLIIFQLSWC